MSADSALGQPDTSRQGTRLNKYGTHLQCIYCHADGFLDARKKQHFDCLCEPACQDCGQQLHPDRECH